MSARILAWSFSTVGSKPDYDVLLIAPLDVYWLHSLHGIVVGSHACAERMAALRSLRSSFCDPPQAVFVDGDFKTNMLPAWLGEVLDEVCARRSIPRNVRLDPEWGVRADSYGNSWGNAVVLELPAERRPEDFWRLLRHAHRPIHITGVRYEHVVRDSWHMTLIARHEHTDEGLEAPSLTREQLERLYASEFPDAPLTHNFPPRKEE